MASTNPPPILRQRTPNMDAADDENHHGHSAGAVEAEPLLGGPGDAVQQEDTPLWRNLYLGTGAIAQGGIILLAVIVWVSVFTKPVILFSAHPLLNSAGLLFVTQAILIVQPTSTPTQKKNGTYAHSTLNNIGLAALLAGLVVILYNKISHAGTHFESPHAIIGLVTYILLMAQSFVGFTAFFLPQLYGSVARAKSLYKYHRMSGYLVLTLMFAAVCSATQTDYSVNVLHLNLWAMLVLGIVTLVGVVPRVRLHKLGLK